MLIINRMILCIGVNANIVIVIVIFVVIVLGVNETLQPYNTAHLRI